MIQRRVDGSVSFDRSWREYRDGFGDLHSEFWLGNNHIHELSTQGDYSLRIDLEDWSIQHKHALYQSFRWKKLQCSPLRSISNGFAKTSDSSYACFSVEDEEHQYRLHVSGFSGTVQDSFGWYHDKQHFSTPDTGNICAEISHGGWWYNQCFYANLNGVYYRVSTNGNLLIVHSQKHKCLLHIANSIGRPLHSKRTWLTGSWWDCLVLLERLGLLLSTQSQHDDPTTQLPHTFVTLNDEGAERRTKYLSKLREMKGWDWGNVNTMLIVFSIFLHW